MLILWQKSSFCGWFGIVSSVLMFHLHLSFIAWMANISSRSIHVRRVHYKNYYKSTSRWKQTLNGTISEVSPKYTMKAATCTMHYGILDTHAKDWRLIASYMFLTSGLQWTDWLYNKKKFSFLCLWLMTRNDYENNSKHVVLLPCD